MNGMANRGAWTADEDRILTEYVERHGPKRWNSVAIHSGLNRCGKSCRLRWMNYLRPDIKRGNISDAEDDLIIRLHSLLGNRWSLIAGRLPGRTDNEIKNYWNAHLWKKASNKALMEKSLPTAQMQNKWNEGSSTLGETNAISCGDGLDLEWVKSFLELDDDL